MRLGLLTQWYDPEPGPAALPGVLARGLVARGHDVTVLTGFPNYPTGRLPEGWRMQARLRAEADGIHLTRTALYPSHESSALSRLLTYGSFGATAATLGLPSLRGLDALWVNYSPITLAPAMLLARYALGVPSVCHVLDLWPDTLGASGVGSTTLPGRLALAGSARVADAMYRTAHSVAYISPSVGDELASRGVPREKLCYAPMWADEDTFGTAGVSMRAELGVGQDQTVLLYAGALGEAQGLDTLIDACAQVSAPGFTCLVAGSGTHEQALRDRAANLSNVRFLGRVPSHRMPDLMATADACFVSLNDHPLARMTLPSKTQATLASGRPLLVAGAGDVAAVAQDSGAGWTVPSGDARALAAAITTMCSLDRGELQHLGERARNYYRKTFAVDTGVDRIERLLEAAAENRTPA